MKHVTRIEAGGAVGMVHGDKKPSERSIDAMQGIVAAAGALMEKAYAEDERRRIPGLMVTLPIRTKNPLNGQMGNSRLAGIIRAGERAKHKEVSYLLVSAGLRGRQDLRQVKAFTVTLTRISAGRMDDDGLAASCKGTRDGIAEALGIDDGDLERLNFVYRQRKGPQKKHWVEALIEPRR